MASQNDNQGNYQGQDNRNNRNNFSVSPDNLNSQQPADPNSGIQNSQQFYGQNQNPYQNGQNPQQVNWQQPNSNAGQPNFQQFNGQNQNSYQGAQNFQQFYGQQAYSNTGNQNFQQFNGQNQYPYQGNPNQQYPNTQNPYQNGANPYQQSYNDDARSADYSIPPSRMIVVQSGNKMSSKKKMIISIAAILVVAIIAVAAVFAIKDSIETRKKNNYNEAIALLEKGKYDEASEIFAKIPDYKDVKQIQAEMVYESYAFSVINEMKTYLKNPDSIVPYSIDFYEADDIDIDFTNIVDDWVMSTDLPVCVMNYAAQNGFGGNSTDYAYFFYNPVKKGYNFGGAVETLDIDDLDSDDEDYIGNMLILAQIIVKQESGVKVGEIDMARVKTVLRNNASYAVKIIE